MPVMPCSHLFFFMLPNHSNQHGAEIWLSKFLFLSIADSGPDNCKFAQKERLS